MTGMSNKNKKKASGSKLHPGLEGAVLRKGDRKPPTICACMIVKNEQELLPQCLKSIKDVAHEIILVDTGSTDKTVEIAESYGARVYHPVSYTHLRAHET